MRCKTWHAITSHSYLAIQWFSQYNDCIGHQENALYIKLSLLRSTIQERM